MFCICVIGCGIGGRAVGHKNDNRLALGARLHTRTFNDGILNLKEFIHSLVDTVLNKCTACNISAGGSNISSLAVLYAADDRNLVFSIVGFKENTNFLIVACVVSRATVIGLGC